MQAKKSYLRIEKIEELDILLIYWALQIINHK